ncbi:hypothetical protein NLX86_18960 [Streptomyces sp. A3M-1-3]|uniref:hypothetical protein n=1 Tax=Streptomyces sp. A3M-1-3 TaxID=2962044 RepID=UPI0020B70312|nr:hypothetical protein [Streptomyces sp. A3M-1-3]MCP3820099.1 hypothetical protein [Streptomyces sp. A3M-1-3]
MLNLTDRAEFNGGLTPAEAARLRAGIRAMDSSRRSTQARLNAAVRGGEAVQLAAVRRLVYRARYRGASAVTVRALDIALAAAVDTAKESA